jgi:hypothetical protein
MGMSGWVVDRRVADGEKESARASARTLSAGFMTGKDVKDAFVRGLLLASLHPWIIWQAKARPLLNPDLATTSLYMLRRWLQTSSAYRSRHSQCT